MLPKKNRLTQKRDFDFVFKHGIFFHCSYMTLVYVESGDAQTKIGFVVSNKVSKKAVVRNKIKRAFRIFFTNYLSQFQGKFVVILAKPDIVKIDQEKIKQELNLLLKKALM